MEGLAVLFLGLGAIAASQEAAYAQYRAGYAYGYPVQAVQAESVYQPAYVYAPAPLPTVGAVTGGLIGAAAGGARGLVAGAMVGGMMGHAASVPAVVPVAPAYAAPAYAYSAPVRSSQGTDQYIQRWQGFMQPSGQR